MPKEKAWIEQSPLWQLPAILKRWISHSLSRLHLPPSLFSGRLPTSLTVESLLPPMQSGEMMDQIPISSLKWLQHRPSMNSLDSFSPNWYIGSRLLASTPLDKASGQKLLLSTPLMYLAIPSHWALWARHRAQLLSHGHPLLQTEVVILRVIASTWKMCLLLASLWFTMVSLFLLWLSSQFPYLRSHPANTTSSRSRRRTADASQLVSTVKSQ